MPASAPYQQKFKALAAYQAYKLHHGLSLPVSRQKSSKRMSKASIIIMKMPPKPFLLANNLCKTTGAGGKLFLAPSMFAHKNMRLP